MQLALPRFYFRPDNRPMIEKYPGLLVFCHDSKVDRRAAIIGELGRVFELHIAASIEDLLRGRVAGRRTALIVGCSRTGLPEMPSGRRAEALLAGAQVHLVGETASAAGLLLPRERYWGGRREFASLARAIADSLGNTNTCGMVSSPFLGSSEALRQVLDAIEKYARSNLSVLILGETGTGKELVAREIHARSSRAAGPFVAINCSTIPDALVESELFGTEKGAFTDAVKHRGAIARASGGTLFLDEIGTLSLSAQPHLLRVLESGEYSKLGSDTVERSDFHLVSATCGNIVQMVEEGRFREDLLYRIADLPIVIPPLRERGGDLEELAQYFCMNLGMGQCTLSPLALEKLVSHPWPGNVRELRSTIARACAKVGSGPIGPDDITFISRLKDEMGKFALAKTY